MLGGTRALRAPLAATAATRQGRPLLPTAELPPPPALKLAALSTVPPAAPPPVPPPPPPPPPRGPAAARCASGACASLLCLPQLVTPLPCSKPAGVLCLLETPPAAWRRREAKRHRAPNPCRRAAARACACARARPRTHARAAAEGPNSRPAATSLRAPCTRPTPVPPPLQQPSRASLGAAPAFWALCCPSLAQSARHLDWPIAATTLACDAQHPCTRNALGRPRHPPRAHQRFLRGSGPCRLLAVSPPPPLSPALPLCPPLQEARPGPRPE
jgi:hypothetical protein